MSPVEEKGRAKTGTPERERNKYKRSHWDLSPAGCTENFRNLELKS